VFLSLITVTLSLLFIGFPLTFLYLAKTFVRGTSPFSTMLPSKKAKRIFIELEPQDGTRV